MNGLKLAGTFADQRGVADRRTFTWRTVVCGFCRSRRRTTRRISEPPPIFTDWHHPWLFFLAVGTMLLSCADAMLTLRLMEHGFYEANPIMAAALNQGVQAFTIWKMLLTALGVLTLVYVSRSRFLNRMRTGLFLTAFFNFYACLVCYQFVSLIGRI